MATWNRHRRRLSRNSSRKSSLGSFKLTSRQAKIEDLFKSSLGKVNLIETVGSLHPDVMEKWVSTTLSDAYHMNIPSLILKGGSSTLDRYHIDRRTLSEAGCKREDVDRMYKALFVYSVGFHQLVHSLCKSWSNPFIVMTNVWKVYLILLEYVYVISLNIHNF